MPMSEIRGYRLLNGDDDLGRIIDFFIQDKTWDPKYLVVNIGGWLTRRKVVLSPAVFGSLDLDEDSIEVSLSRKEIEEGPTLAQHETVSAKHRKAVAVYYAWPTGWAAGIGAPAMIPTIPVNQETVASFVNAGKAKSETPDDPTEDNLRSFKEIKGYSIEATDGSIGHVEDIIVDPVDWKSRYLVVDTRNWLPGRKVLVGIHWLDSLSFTKQSASLKLERKAIESSPEYDPKGRVDSEFEKRIHEHYGLPTYWV